MTKIVDLKSTDVCAKWLSKQMRNFPKCGVRFGGDGFGHGFVLISPNLRLAEIKIVEQKVEAAKIKSKKSISRLVIPYQLARAAGL
jgi:hypothetical protein